MTKLTWPDKDPDDVAPYSIDWTGELAGDTIASSEWFIPDDLAKGLEGTSDNVNTVWLSGGVDGKTYVVVNRVVTGNGLTIDKGVSLYVVSSGKDRLTGEQDSIFAGIDMSDPCAVWPRMQKALDQLLVGESAVRVRFQQHETEFRPANISDLRSRVAELKAECEAKTSGRVRRHAIRGGFRCL